MARGSWPQLRPLEGIVESPVLRADGSVLDRPGYDPATGLLFEPNTEFQPVPDRPTGRDVEQALEALFEVVCDFPFSTPAHRSAWLSSVLSCLARFAFPGPSPMNLYDANVRGVGKSLLANEHGTNSRFCAIGPGTLQHRAGCTLPRTSIGYSRLLLVRNESIDFRSPYLQYLIIGPNSHLAGSPL